MRKLSSAHTHTNKQSRSRDFGMIHIEIHVKMESSPKGSPHAGGVPAPHHWGCFPNWFLFLTTLSPCIVFHQCQGPILSRGVLYHLICQRSRFILYYLYFHCRIDSFGSRNPDAAPLAWRIAPASCSESPARPVLFPNTGNGKRRQANRTKKVSTKTPPFGWERKCETSIKSKSMALSLAVYPPLSLSLPLPLSLPPSPSLSLPLPPSLSLFLPLPLPLSLHLLFRVAHKGWRQSRKISIWWRHMKARQRERDGEAGYGKIIARRRAKITSRSSQCYWLASRTGLA